MEVSPAADFLVRDCARCPLPSETLLEAPAAQGGGYLPFLIFHLRGADDQGELPLLRSFSDDFIFFTERQLITESLGV